MSALKLMELLMLSIIYLLFAFIMLGVILREHPCTHCYYYDKLCSLAGKIEFMFIQRENR